MLLRQNLPLSDAKALLDEVIAWTTPIWWQRHACTWLAQYGPGKSLRQAADSLSPARLPAGFPQKSAMGPKRPFHENDAALPVPASTGLLARVP